MDFVCPYKCSYRTNSGYCGRTGGFESCQYRQLHQPNTAVGYVPPLKKTNADRIRAMADEELAEKIGESIDCEVCKTMHHSESGECPCRPHQSCVDFWLDWLKQEVNE